VTPPTDGAPAGVLHFVSDWLPASEVFVYDLVRHLRRPGVVVAATSTANLDRFPVAHLRSLRPVDRYLHPKALRPMARTAVLRWEVGRHGLGIVHAHHGYRLDIPAGLVRRRRLPLVLSAHGHDLTGYLEREPDAYRQLVDLVDAVVVPSRFLASLVPAAGFPAEKVHVIPSGVDMRRFAPTPLPTGDPVVLFVGRFVAKKGIDTLAAAWPEIARAVPEARLRLMGFGPLEPLARSIPGRVTVEVEPDTQAVSAAMREAYLVVTPSHRAPDDAVETLLMVNVEAQASGRPVVTTDHGGIPEYVRADETALVVEEADPEALAAAVVRLLEDRELAVRLGAAGPGAVVDLDVRVTSARVEALYDELLAG
jgi:colanic acid/amylovoran biosynthesis glycosyltransferase